MSFLLCFCQNLSVFLVINPFKRSLKSFIFTDCVRPSILLYNTVLFMQRTIFIG
ncbi:hypothetical protein EC40967_3803 [Escherichia coli 4.0967]|uniref:Uncharacterized protein n=1 Tax=Escherichia coli 4.0967 TaxID=869687 RepID=A0AAN3V0U6_ECOLX|nr:hypothetical protein EcE22_3329 [Escherichia coli E22]EHW78189.1 hypothetical protein ECDEC10D_2972 [Escherichia coli DEC10D]EII32573.1 hypothetical protein EC40967_3803 [Escherichia coli 4.0967]